MRFKHVAWPEIAIFAFAAVSASGYAPTKDKIEFKTIDGVPHVFNPAKPLKGTIKLEIERTRTIDPYEQPEVGMRMILFFHRGEKGGVVLLDPNSAEGHRFGPDGKYLGLLTKKGQGPGEFSPQQGYYAYLFGNDVFVFGGQKVARFDSDGKLLQERTLKSHHYASVDATRFLTENIVRDEKGNQTKTLQIVEFDFKEKENKTDLLKAVNVGMIRNPNGRGGISEPWATPGLFYAADPSRGYIFCGINTKYEIWIKDLAGKDVLVIQRAFENVKAKRDDVAKMMAWAAKEERTKWILSAYPDRFVAIKDIFSLPKGYLAAFRVTGPEQFEIDVFSPKGEYLYALVPPVGIELRQVQFFSTGFAVLEMEGDSFAYREYRIKNLPEIFGK
ncbi:MAG: hypothetical protein PHI34_02690 [Acidobacteriota bacterium]|nr:hypothetical protein [Acidobacteriota bacterium]